MAARSKDDSFRYVYCVLPATAAGDAAGAGPDGVDGRPVEVTALDDVAALTSTVAGPRARPSRANVLAHEKVVGTAHRNGPTAPVRFGTVVSGGKAEVRTFLEEDGHYFRALLKDFEDRDEYRLKCRYLPDLALREVVESSRAIQRLRDKQRSGRTVQPSEQIRLGEVVAAGLEDLRRRDAVATLQAVRSQVQDWSELEERSDEVAVHLAVMVERAATAGLEQALERFADQQSGRLQIELVGPLPLWDFVPDLSAVT